MGCGPWGTSLKNSPSSAPAEPAEARADGMTEPHARRDAAVDVRDDAPPPEETPPAPPLPTLLVGGRARLRPQQYCAEKPPLPEKPSQSEQAPVLAEPPRAEEPPAAPANEAGGAAASLSPAVEEAPEAQPNPPQWGVGVRVFGPEDEDVAEVVAAAFAVNGGQEPHDNGEFSMSRYAFLFKPGTYEQDVPVGFYTSVIGLGVFPDDVVFRGTKGVHCRQSDAGEDGAMRTCWRSAERFSSLATFPWDEEGEGMLWAVSQGSPLRSVRVRHELILSDHAGGAGGGFSADCLFEGGVKAHGEQTGFARNLDVRRFWSGRQLNQVFVGSGDVPLPRCCKGAAVGASPVSVVGGAECFVAEKPYISMLETDDGSDRFCLRVPDFHHGREGSGYSSDPCPERIIDFESVYVARPEVDNAETLNARLASKWIGALVLSPGIYELEAPLLVKRSDLVILGLGYATLRPRRCDPVLRVSGDATGVRIAGLLVEAGPALSPCLIEWGSLGASADRCILQDVFCRVGGPYSYETAADTMVHIKSNGLVCDNLWLWRADHTVDGPTPPGANPCTSALRVDGDDVKIYGLVAEHALQDVVVWNGDRGATYFAKITLPFDATHEYGERSFCGYRVAEWVSSHTAVGIGIHHCFRDHFVEVPCGISCPLQLQSSFVSPVCISQQPSNLGSVLAVTNGVGATTGPIEVGAAYVHGAPLPSPDERADPGVVEAVSVHSIPDEETPDAEVAQASEQEAEKEQELKQEQEEGQEQVGDGEGVFPLVADLEERLAFGSDIGLVLEPEPLTPRLAPVICWCMW